MSKINLLYVITKLELGGAQKQLLSLIRGLDKQVYNIFLFTSREGLLLEEAQGLEGVVLKRSAFLGRKINPAMDLCALWEIYGFIKKNNIQLVHTHSSKAGILGRLAAGLAKTKAVVHTVHGWSFHDHQSRAANSGYLFLERICAAFTSKIITVSRWDKDKGLDKKIGKTGQYVLIRYGIDYGSFQDNPSKSLIRDSLGLGDELVVGTVACFKPQKAPLDFIKLAYAVNKNFPRVKFLMIGDGILMSKARLLAEKMHLEGQVIFTGWRKDVAQILPALDLFVLTSLWEGLPIAVLEAMAAGIPVVATDTGGIAEAVTCGKTGYLVRPGDIPKMQNRVEQLLKNAQERNEIAKLSRQVAAKEEFSVGQMVRDTSRLYLELTREGKCLNI